MQDVITLLLNSKGIKEMLKLIAENKGVRRVFYTILAIICFCVTITALSPVMVAIINK